MLFSDPPGIEFSRQDCDTDMAITTRTTTKHLHELTVWINRYCTEHDLAESLPPVNGRPWVITTRQFRRTLAWFIARRPGGSIAGAIAYRHLSIQMFEGYASTSDSGFRAEVEAEQALARGEDLMSIATDHPHPAISGPAADEASRRLSTLSADSSFAGTVLTDRPRIARRNETIRPGRLPRYLRALRVRSGQGDVSTTARPQRHYAPAARALPTTGVQQRRVDTGQPRRTAHVGP